MKLCYMTNFANYQIRKYQYIEIRRLLYIQLYKNKECYYHRYDIFIFCLLLLSLGISGLYNNDRDTSRHLRSQTLFLSIQSVIIYY